MMALTGVAPRCVSAPSFPPCVRMMAGAGCYNNSEVVCVVYLFIFKCYDVMLKELEESRLYLKPSGRLLICSLTRESAVGLEIVSI